MPGKFGFFSDPALTTPIRGAVVMTFLDGSDAKAIVYFGSKVDSDHCFSAAGGQISITADAVSATVNLSLDSGSTGAPSVDIGPSVLGGVANAIPIYISVSGAGENVVIAASRLVEYANG